MIRAKTSSRTTYKGSSMEGDTEVVQQDPYPNLLQIGIRRLRGHLTRFGYGIAETRPRADQYFLRFGTDEASLLVSISVDAAGWQLVFIGRGVKYESDELKTRVPTLEALGELLKGINPPTASNAPPKPKQMAEGKDNRLAYLAGAFAPSSITVDDLLHEKATTWQKPT